MDDVTRRAAGLALPRTRWAGLAERASRLLPLWVGLAAFVLALIALPNRPLWYDEAQSVHFARESYGHIWRAARHTEAPHLVYYALLKPWLVLMGTSRWAARLPSALGGAGAAAVTALLGARLLGRHAGLIAGLLLASSAYVVSWSQQARPYTLAMLVAGAATLLFVRAIETPARGAWARWAVSIVAATALSLFAISVAAAHAAAYAVGRRDGNHRAPALALAAAAVGCAPFVVLVADGNNGQLGWIRAPTLHSVANGLWDWASGNPFTLLAAAVGAVALARVPAERWKAALLTTWLVSPAALTLLLSIHQPAFEPRYLLSAEPALALLAAAGVVAVPRLAGGALLSLAGALAAGRLVQHYTGTHDTLRSWLSGLF